MKKKGPTIELFWDYQGEKAYNIGILEFFYKDKKGSRIIIESHR